MSQSEPASTEGTGKGANLAFAHVTTLIFA